MKKKSPGFFTQMFKLTVYGAFAMAFCIVITLLLSFSTGNKSGGNRVHKDRRDFTQMELMDQIHRKQLRKIQSWFIETGFGEFYKTRNMESVEEYVKNRGYRFRVEPSIDEYHTHKGKKYHTLARIVIQAKFIYNQLWCLAQVEHNGKIYEYWVMQEKARKGKYDYLDCAFMVSEADNKEGSRKIIHTSPQFFDKYKVSEDFVFSFPKERVIPLRVSYYPECYQGTEMEEVQKILARIK